MSDNGRCKTCGGEGEIETGQTTAARCVDCAGTGKTGGEPPNRPLSERRQPDGTILHETPGGTLEETRELKKIDVDEFVRAFPELAASAASIIPPDRLWEIGLSRSPGITPDTTKEDPIPAKTLTEEEPIPAKTLIEEGRRVMEGPNPPIRIPAVRTHKWSDIKAGMRRRDAELWKGEQQFEPPVKPIPPPSQAERELMAARDEAAATVKGLQDKFRIDPAVLSASLTAPEKVKPPVILADEQTHALLAELTAPQTTTDPNADGFTKYERITPFVSLFTKDEAAWRDVRAVSGHGVPVAGYVDTPHGLFTPDAVIGKFRPAVTEARMPGQPDDWPPPFAWDADDVWRVSCGWGQSGPPLFELFSDAVECAGRLLECWDGLGGSVSIENKRRGVRLLLDPKAPRPDDRNESQWIDTGDRPAVETPHLSRESPQDDEYKHRGGIVERPGLTFFGVNDPPEYGGPLSFFARIDPKILEDLKKETEPIPITLVLPKPVEFSLKDLTESVIKPTPSRDYSERLPRHPQPRVVGPQLAGDLLAIQRDADAARAASLEHAKEGARRYRTDATFHAMVHLVAGAINQLLDGWDEVGDRHHLARRVRETVMDILPAVEAMQPHLVAGDRMLFSSELLGEIAKQTLGTLVRVREVRRNDDGTKTVVLEPCTD